jgi:hypothetical protein
MIKMTVSGSFENTKRSLKEMSTKQLYSILGKYGQMGVDALRAATPVRTGATASAWRYAIVRSANGVTIEWHNDRTSPTNSHVYIALLIQYGHGTGTGGYVAGVDYINPAMKPVFDTISKNVWKEVSKL